MTSSIGAMKRRCALVIRSAPRRSAVRSSGDRRRKYRMVGRQEPGDTKCERSTRRKGCPIQALLWLR